MRAPASRLPPAPLVPGPADPRQRRHRHRLVPARRARRWTTRTGAPGHARSLGVFLNGERLDSTDPRGDPVVDDSFYILFNAHDEPRRLPDPGRGVGARWLKVLDTFDPAAGEEPYGARAPVPVRGPVPGGPPPCRLRPRATYRVQLHKGFGFDAARGAGGVPRPRWGSAICTARPSCRPSPGRTHGYDVVDHAKVNAELGGEEGFARLAAALRARGDGPAPRRRAQPHGHRHAAQPLVVGRAGERPVAAATPPTSTSTGTRPRPSCATPCSCPCSRTTTAACSRQALLRRRAARTARSRSATTTTSGRSRPRSIDALLAAAAERCGSDELAFIADAHGRLAASTATDVGAIRRRHRAQGGPPADAGAALPRAAGRGRGRGRGDRSASTATRTRSTRCSSARTTAWPSGRRRRATSATGASST